MNTNDPHNTAATTRDYGAARAAYEAILVAADAVVNNDSAWVAAMDAATDAHAVMLTARDAYWAAQAAAAAAPPVVVAPRAIDAAAVATLRQYALNNYEAGGHWAYETHEDADFQEYIDDANGNMKAAKRALREYWKLIESVGNDIANS
jgi:hypothetical protein